MTQPSVAHGQMPLAEGFEPQTHEDWQRLVAGVLNKRRREGEHLDGPAAEAALRTVLEGGLTTDPLYLREDRPLGAPGAAPFTRGRAQRDPTAPWDVRQLHEDPDAAAADVAGASPAGGRAAAVSPAMKHIPAPPAAAPQVTRDMFSELELEVAQLRTEVARLRERLRQMEQTVGVSPGAIESPADS